MCETDEGNSGRGVHSLKQRHSLAAALHSLKWFCCKFWTIDLIGNWYFFAPAVRKKHQLWNKFHWTSAQITPRSLERLTWWVISNSQYIHTMIPTTLPWYSPLSALLFFWCTWLEVFRGFASTRLAGLQLVHDGLKQRLQAIWPSL